MRRFPSEQVRGWLIQVGNDKIIENDKKTAMQLYRDYSQHTKLILIKNRSRNKSGMTNHKQPKLLKSSYLKAKRPQSASAQPHSPILLPFAAAFLESGRNNGPSCTQAPFQY